MRLSSRGRLAWRASTVGLLILAATGISVPTGDAPMTVVAALDRSSSMPVRAQQQAVATVNALAAGMRPGDRLGVVTFGADVALERRPSEKVEQTSVRSLVAGTGTDIGAALRLARSLLPAEGPRRIVLLSDGRDTSGTAEREALLTASARIAIDALPPHDVAVPIRVTRVHASSVVAVGEPYTVSIDVSGSPGERGRIALYRDDDPIAEPEVIIGADGTSTSAWSERQDRAGEYVYRASIDTGAADADTHSAGTVVVVHGQPALLYVTSSLASLPATLEAAGYSVTRVTPENLPATTRELSAFAAVILDDVQAEELSSDSLNAVSSYVQHEGGGLLLLGGARSLALTGYPTTPLEAIIPIDLRPRAGQTAAAVDLVIVFDKSGSMADVAGALPKIEVARQAVLRAFAVMPASDHIGVLAFDARPQVVLPLTSARDVAALRTALDRVLPGGATSIAPAVETAQRWLLAPDRPPAARRQILLVSDGRTSETDAAQLRTLARTRGIEMSVAAIGPNADRGLLEELARSSGGRAYFPLDVRDLPRAVARAAARSSGGGVVNERFRPRPTAHAALTGIDAASLPSLGGYVVASTKPTATAILSSHLDDPVLAVWRAGLGRVAVFTAGLGSSWSAPLRAWRNEGRLWTQMVRWLSRDDTDRSLQAVIRDGGQGPRLEVEAEGRDGQFLTLDEGSVLIRTPAGVAQPTALEATAPGRYEARIPVTIPGPYVVALTARDRAQAEHRFVRALYWSADVEGRARGVDRAALSRFAVLTGGRVLGDGESPFDGPRPSGARDVSREAAAIALAMFVLDVTTVGGVRLRRLRPRREGARRAA